MRIVLIVLLVTCTLALGIQGTARSHCEVPCGIYGDLTRIVILKEHIATIEKAMRQSTALGGEETPNYNQLIRWTRTKEEHANQIQHIVTQYFMTQRIKPQQEKYIEKLTTLHKMLIAAMKTKQTTDLSHVAELGALVETFSGLYFSAEDQEHLKGHHGK